MRAATKAFDAYVSAEGMHVFSVFAGGSLRIIFGLAVEAKLQAERTKDLAGFAAFVAAPVTPADIARAGTDSAKALLDAMPSSDLPPDAQRDQKKTLDDAQAAWRRYRDAEVAFYTHVFKAQGEAQVRDAVTTMLTTRRTKALVPPEP
jgi:hypothetical protein